jgi:hypothetical protein
MRRYDLNLEWRPSELMDKGGTRAQCHMVSAAYDIEVDTRQDSKQIAGAMLHEIIEIITRLAGITMEEEAITEIADCLGQFVVENGFDPGRVMAKGNDVID